MSFAISDIRVFVYETLLDGGRMPTAADMAEHFGVTRDDVVDTLRTARIGKTLLPDPHTGEIWMAGPFSARPTTYEVRRGARRWWANCAWDMLGVANLVGHPVDISARCTDCGNSLDFQFAAATGTVPDWVVHFLVPARRWYDDIGFT